MNRWTRRVWLSVCMALLAGAGQTRADTWLIEAEKSGGGTVGRTLPRYNDKAVVRWKVAKTNEASGGFMGLLGAERKPVRQPHPPRRRLSGWVRHYKTVGKPTSFYLLFRDEIKAGAGFRNVDWYPRARDPHGAAAAAAARGAEGPPKPPGSGRAARRSSLNGP